MAKEFTDIDLKRIHMHLHSETASISVLNKTFNIEVGKNGLRYVEISDVIFMQHNYRKASKYSLLCKQGFQVTWGMRPGPWIYITRDPDGKYDIQRHGPNPNY